MNFSGNNLRAALMGTFALCVGLLRAQTDYVQSSEPMLAEARHSFGMQLERSAWLNDSDWRQLLPGSELLKQDLPLRGGEYQPGYGHRGRRGSSGELIALGVVSMGVALDLDRHHKSQDNYDKRLRLGWIYGGVENTDAYWGRSETAAYDTVVSQSTGVRFPLDSTWKDTYEAKHSRSRLGLDAALIVHKRTPNRWSWCVGVGATLGGTVNGRAEVAHTIVHSREEIGDTTVYDSVLVDRETFRTRSTFWCQLYAQIGVDWQLGRNSRFWRRLHLFHELRPVMIFKSQPTMPMQSIGGLQNVFGIRVDLR